jgi:hypothetical protein
MRGAIPPPQYAFMAWCLVKHRDNFTFCVYNLTSHSILSRESGSYSAIKNIQRVYVTLKFIRSCHWGPVLSPMHTVHHIFTYVYLRSILISYHLHLGFPSGLLRSGVPTKILYEFLTLSCMLHVSPISSSLI